MPTKQTRANNNNAIINTFKRNNTIGRNNIKFNRKIRDNINLNNNANKCNRLNRNICLDNNRLLKTIINYELEDSGSRYFLPLFFIHDSLWIVIFKNIEYRKSFKFTKKSLDNTTVTAVKHILSF